MDGWQAFGLRDLEASLVVSSDYERIVSFDKSLEFIGTERHFIEDLPLNDLSEEIKTRNGIISRSGYSSHSDYLSNSKEKDLPFLAVSLYIGSDSEELNSVRDVVCLARSVGIKVILYSDKMIYELSSLCKYTLELDDENSSTESSAF